MVEFEDGGSDISSDLYMSGLSTLPSPGIMGLIACQTHVYLGLALDRIQRYKVITIFLIFFRKEDQAKKNKNIDPSPYMFFPFSLFPKIFFYPIQTLFHCLITKILKATAIQTASCRCKFFRLILVVALA